MNGISIDFLFGKVRNDSCRVEDEVQKCFVQSAILIRNRFDLLSNTDREKRLSLKYMHEFVNQLDTITKTDKYPLFDISYHTTHTLQEEIVKYSGFDFHYVLLAIISFWIIYFLFMWFDFKMFRMHLKQKVKNTLNDQKSSKNHTFFLGWFKEHMFWINSSGFLVLATCAQFFFTILSTMGLMSLMSVPLNQLLYSIIFILMIINCHQSLMLYRNVSDYKLKKNNVTSENSNKLDELIDFVDGVSKDKSFFELDIEAKLRNAVQIILVPSFCTLCTSVSAYLIIGITSSFDAIRYYCFFSSG